MTFPVRRYSTIPSYPDVSANGVNYVVAVDGQFSRAFGTSASTPTFASLVNLINEQRIAAKKSPVGFMNPQVMNDITKWW